MITNASKRKQTKAGHWAKKIPPTSTIASGGIRYYFAGAAGAGAGAAGATALGAITSDA